MAKRVSIKGRGADLFFGDYTPPNRETPPSGLSENKTANEIVPTVASSPSAKKNALKPDSKIARMPERSFDRLPERQKEGREVSKNARPPEYQKERPVSPDVDDVTSEALDAIWSDLKELATVKNSFRYSEQEITALTDVVYALFRQYRVRVSKQDLARLGLNFVLWDFECRGEKSLLVQFVERMQRKAA